MLQLRTKIETILVASFLIMLSAVGVLSVNRTITPTSDDVATFIRNSNGNYWECTGANLQQAIWDLNNTRGAIWVGGDITLTSTIRMRGCNATDHNILDHIKIDFEGHTITLGADIEFLNMSGVKYCVFEHLRIITSSVQTEDIITLRTDQYGTALGWTARCDYNIFEDIYIRNGGATHPGPRPVNWNFTAFDLHTDTDSRFDQNIFRNIVIWGSGTAIRLNANHDGTYINGNTFDTIYVDLSHTVIDFLKNASSTGANENLFNNIKAQSGAYSVYGIRNVSGTANRFTNMLPDWDWTVADNPSYVLWINSDAVETYYEGHRNLTLSIDVLDEGLSSVIIHGNRIVNYDADYTNKITTNGTWYFNRVGENGYIPASGSDVPTKDFQNLMEGLVDHDNTKIKISNGTFLPDRYIAIDGENITIEGEYDHATILKIPENDAMVSGMFSADGLTESRLTFRNIVFDGTGASGTSRCIYFGSSASINSLTVENCIFLNWSAGTSAAIYLRANSNDITNDVRIINCKFYNSYRAIHFDLDADSFANNSLITGNYFEDCTTGVILDYCYNTTVSNNHFVRCVTGIDEQGSSNYNIIAMNNAGSCTTPIDINGVNTIHFNSNIGTVS